jgi:hypothetical protein
LLLAGCSSTIDLSGTQRLYRQGNYEAAYRSLLARQDEIVGKQGSLVFNLDGGVLSHFEGAWERSNAMLAAAEREITENYTESITANIGSFLVNDNTKEYQGEDFEDIYTNVFKALNYTGLGEDEDALVELRRSIEKQSLLKSKYEKQADAVAKYAIEQGVESVPEATYSTSFSSSALSNYLAMVIARGTGDRNMFDYSFEQVSRSFETQPELYRFPIPTFLSEEEDAVPSGMARLNFVAFNGLAPEKKEAVESVYVSPYNYAKIAYPVLVARRSDIRAVRIRLEDATLVPLEQIESIDTVAIETFKAKAALTRMKAVVRSMLKAIGIAVYDQAEETKAQENETQRSTASELLSFILKIASNVSETADVRSSHFLPATAWAGGITVEEGTYTIVAEFLDRAGRTVYTHTVPDYPVSSGKTNIVEAICPF